MLLGAIGVGLSDPNFVQKILNSKITQEFSEKIDLHYLQPFAQKNGFSDEELTVFRKKTTKSLKKLAKNKLFEVERITDDDLY